MVHKSIDIKELICIEWWMHCNGVLNRHVVLMCWQEMNSSINKMNNSEVGITVVIHVWFNHPKPCVFIRFRAHMWIPLNQCTGIFFVLMLKWKEKKDVHYFKPMNTCNLGIWVDQNSVIMCMAFPPWWCCSYMLAPHASYATDIAWGIKCWNSWVENVNSSLDFRKLSWWWFGGCIITMKLLI